MQSEKKLTWKFLWRMKIKENKGMHFSFNVVIILNAVDIRSAENIGQEIETTNFEKTRTTFITVVSLSLDILKQISEC